MFAWLAAVGVAISQQGDIIIIIIKFVTKPNLSQPWQVRRIPSPLFPQVRKMYFNLHPRSHVTVTTA